MIWLGALPALVCMAECPEGDCGHWYSSSYTPGTISQAGCNTVYEPIYVASDGSETCKYYDPCQGCTRPDETRTLSYACTTLMVTPDEEDIDTWYWEVTCTAPSACESIAYVETSTFDYSCENCPD